MSETLLDGLFALSENWAITLGITAIFFSGYALSFLLGKKPKQEASLKYTLSVFFFISLLLRFAYIQDIFVPPYFDSAEHFRIIKAMLEGLRSSTFLASFSGLTPNYYHLGYHTLVSLLVFGLRANPINVMLVFGQITLTILPIPIFFLVWRETESRQAAFFSALLAGFGWSMPGFAINWGKYPALTGLLVFEVVLLITYINSRKKTQKKYSLAKIVLVLGILLSVFIHSRTLILFLISFSSYFLSRKIITLEKEIQYKILRIGLLGIFIFGILIYREPFLKLALEPYINEGTWITAIVFLLAPFATHKYPQGLHFSLFFILFLFISLFIPVTKILPAFETQSLLDRPFVEISLFFPLSILGGLGFAALTELLKDIKFLDERIPKLLVFLIVSLFFGSIGFFITKNYNFYPSDCCNFVKYDDTIAFEWINNNLPTNTSILIASNRLNVLPFIKSTDLVGSDAGIWIPQLINRKTFMAPYELDFLSNETRGFLCRNQANYIYVGNKEQSFDPRALLQKREWYQKILSLPNAQLFQLTNCFERK